MKAKELANTILKRYGKQEGVCFNASFHTTDCVIIMPWDSIHPAGDVIGKGRNCREAWEDALMRLLTYTLEGIVYKESNQVH